MRSQRRSPQTVQLVSVTIAEDEFGNETLSTSSTTIEGAIFEPERPLERTGDNQAPVFQPAVWNLPGVRQVDADDQIIHGTGEDAMTWYVAGGGVVWLDRTKVPVQQTRAKGTAT